MAIPSTVADLNATASSNYPLGTESPGTIDDYLRSHAAIIRQVSDSKDSVVADLATASDTKGSALVGFKQSGTSAVATTVQDKLRELVSVKDFGSDLASINNAISQVSDGILKIPPGDYTINGDVLIQSKNTGGSTSGEGFFTLDATGARFNGSGRIIVDSCKRVKIIGLDAPNHDLHWRGVWWSSFEDMRYRKLVIGDAVGTSFSSQYWNRIVGGQSQAIVHDAASTSAANEITWDGHSLRGNTGQGFSGTADYAFEFNANQNTQSWKFINGDVSYHTTAIYSIGTGNTTGGIELSFDGAYFDSLIPAPLSRDKARIIAKNCHHANGTAYDATLQAATAGAVELVREDRSFKHNAFSLFNLIPNGDFRESLTTWVGSGLPINTLGGATLTVKSGGLSGNYLNINQPNTSSNTVRFSSKTLPNAGRVTGVLVIRNADVGSKALRISIAGLFHSPTVTNTEWSVITITNPTVQAAGTQPSIQILTQDGTAFNVDIAYVAMTLGEGGPLIFPSAETNTISAEAVYDPPSIAAAGTVSFDLTVAGAEVGDFVIVAPGTSIGQLELSAPVVVGLNTVRCRLTNPTGAAIDIASSTWRIKVLKRTYV